MKLSAIDIMQATNMPINNIPTTILIVLKAILAEFVLRILYLRHFGEYLLLFELRRFHPAFAHCL